MDTLKIPLEYNRDGFTHITDGSDEYYKQLLSITARTESGVSPIFPDFGVQDPTFDVIDNGRFLINASRYIPEIILTDIQSTIDDSGNNFIKFNFTRR
jgi:hypothetical protein